MKNRLMHENAPYKENNWAEGLIEMYTSSYDFIVVKLAWKNYEHKQFLFIIERKIFNWSYGIKVLKYYSSNITWSALTINCI